MSHHISCYELHLYQLINMCDCLLWTSNCHLILKVSKQLPFEINVIGRARIQYSLRRVWMTTWWCNGKWKERKVRIITIWLHDIDLWSWFFLQLIEIWTITFQYHFSLQKAHWFFSICDYQLWLPIEFLLIFLLRFGLLFSHGQYLCWCVTGRTLLFLPLQFKVHKSSGHLTVGKGCPLIDQCKHKSLVSLIKEKLNNINVLSSLSITTSKFVKYARSFV